jgi:hypothetical protein
MLGRVGGDAGAETARPDIVGITEIEERFRGVAG